MPGRVVNVAIDLGVRVCVGEDLPPAPAGTFAERLNTAVARRLGVTAPGLRITGAELPAGSGLGSSGALSVALAYAAGLYAGAGLTPDRVVALACAAERDTGLTGGTQDQLASMYGGAGLVLRHADIGRRTPIGTDLDQLGRRLVLVHATGSRVSGSIIDAVLAEPRAAALRTIAAMNEVGDSLAARLRGDEFDGVAELMNESTRLLAELHEPIVETGVAERLRALGAAAAKPCGAGGTGAVWATLVDPGRRPAYLAAAAEAGWSVLPAAPRATGAGPG